MAQSKTHASGRAREIRCWRLRGIVGRTAKEFRCLQGHKRERFRPYSSTLYFRQCAMHKMDRDRTLANG